MYSMKLACVNCHHTQTHKLTKGVTLETWLESKPKCSFCNCQETLQSIHEYAMRKKMFEDFIKNEHNHDHDHEHSDTTGHNQYA
jgi:hypothetical protein|tara:strand:- start:511 stop:762 length:252 start_codon:yes stop_codon:yes gene_type:complete